MKWGHGSPIVEAPEELFDILRIAYRGQFPNATNKEWEDAASTLENYVRDNQKKRGKPEMEVFP